MRFVNGRFEYLIRQKDKMPSKIFPSPEAFDQCPSLAFDFLQQHINITGDDIVDQAPTELTQAFGDPLRVGCKLKFIFA